MIQVEDALLLIQQHTHKLPAKKIKVKKSLGYILSEAVYSPMDMPPFRQSAMDGYAFLYGDSTRYEVVNTIAAGHFSTIEIKKDQAVRIFTGAFVPDNLDTVVMQEHTVANGNKMEIIKMPSKFSNVRNKGEQVKINELVLQQNTPITAAAIGFLTCLGITEIAVYDKPKVGIIVTGDELVRAGEQLPKGAIYESNSVMLEAALQQMGIKKVKIYGVKDTLKATKKVIKNNLDKFDVVLVSGGISVGDYDFVKEALWSNGVEELFYKINQKPGKPLFFGKKNNTLVFALPGNPASALTCFYVYVQQALKKMMGQETFSLPNIKRKITSDTKNNSGKSLFLKAFYNEDEVRILDGQSSAMLNTFAVANGFIFLPYHTTEIKKNEEVTVIPF